MKNKADAPATDPTPPENPIAAARRALEPSHQDFLNHWTACAACKPYLNRYCKDGQRLKRVYDRLCTAYFAPLVK